MPAEIYTDGFANIMVTGTIVRIDLMSVAGQDADGKPRFETRERLILPLDGFLRSYAMSDDVVGKLEKAGIVNRRTPPAAGPTIAASAPAAPASPSKKK